MELDKIEVGDLVCVNIHSAQFTPAHRAKVLRMPCATGDSWVFKSIIDNTIIYISEGCTVSLIEKAEAECNCNVSGFTVWHKPECRHYE